MTAGMVDVIAAEQHLRVDIVNMVAGHADAADMMDMQTAQRNVSGHAVAELTDTNGGAAAGNLDVPEYQILTAFDVQRVLSRVGTLESYRMPGLGPNNNRRITPADVAENESSPVGVDAFRQNDRLSRTQSVSVQNRKPVIRRLQLNRLAEGLPTGGDENKEQADRNDAAHGWWTIRIADGVG